MCTEMLTEEQLFNNLVFDNIVISATELIAAIYVNTHTYYAHKTHTHTHTQRTYYIHTHTHTRNHSTSVLSAIMYRIFILRIERDLPSYDC